MCNEVVDLVSAIVICRIEVLESTEILIKTDSLNSDSEIQCQEIPKFFERES